jgi:hypothetical protein
MDDYMLSTEDNPYNPFTHFDEWNAWDVRAGYHTTSYLARIIITSDQLSEADQDQAYHDAVDEILSENIRGIYMRVPNPSTSSDSSDGKISQ